MTPYEENLDLEGLVGTIEPTGSILRHWNLKGGVSAEMTGVDIHLTNGDLRRIVVRRAGTTTLERNPHVTEHEFYILKVADGLGVPVQKILRFSRGDLFSERPYLVLEYVEGNPVFHAQNVPSFAANLAEVLAQIHTRQFSPLELPGIRIQAATFAENFGDRPAEMQLSPLERRIRDVLEKQWPFTKRNGLRLLHGDYWSGNVLWRDSRIVAVIDWENAKIGEPLWDFAIARLDLFWIYGAETQKKFSDAYRRSTDLDYRDLPLWDLCAALQVIRFTGENLAMWAAVFPALGRHDITEATMKARLEEFIENAFAALGPRST